MSTSLRDDILNAVNNKFFKEKLKYGIIREFSNGTSLWYEPITNKRDGFVIRDSNGGIIEIWK